MGPFRADNKSSAEISNACTLKKRVFPYFFVYPMHIDLTTVFIGHCPSWITVFRHKENYPVALFFPCIEGHVVSYDGHKTAGSNNRGGCENNETIYRLLGK